MKQIIFISTLSILCTIYPAHFEAVNDYIIELRAEIGQPANNLHPFGPVITVAQTRKSTPKCNFVFTGRWRCNNQRNN